MSSGLKMSLGEEKPPTYGSFGKETSISLDQDQPAGLACGGGKAAAAAAGKRPFRAVSFHDIEYFVSSRCFSKWKQVIHGVR